MFTAHCDKLRRCKSAARMLGACISMFAVGAGCQATREKTVSPDETAVKVIADAFSFNARLWREGKPTTFKLELYVTDDLIGMAGRGYLGKGALKGWLSADSIKVYFPSTNEFFDESIDNLVNESACSVPPAGLNLLHLATDLPDSLALYDRMFVTSDYHRPAEPEFEVKPRDTACRWQVTLDYDRQSSGWAVQSFRFDNGQGLVLKATRERFRAGVRVPRKRFEVAVPADAVRITP